MGKTERPMAESHAAHCENETPHGGSPSATGRTNAGGSGKETDK